ncbi:ABC transporter ATP-binding protein [Roseobacter ponti]|nr:ABC transporter ATP-binding protein [Roseobacter ponti]
MSAISIQSLHYTWPGATEAVLNIGRFDLQAGETVFLSGPSGSGKSTLLAAIAGVIDIPDGTVTVRGQDLSALSGSARDRFRAAHLGIIFQVFNLLPWLSPVENVLLPCRFSGIRRQQAGPDPAVTAAHLLRDLGLGDPALQNAPASALSVGQQQRVAAARALIGAPGVVLADEPTSALDEDAKTGFVDLLLRECAAAGTSLLFVSHDRSLARHFDRAEDLRDLQSAGVPC